VAANKSRIFVVDTCVVRSAGGEDAVFPTSKHCRDFLKNILTICHRVVLTSEIGTEWHKHASGFARKWRVQMESRKKICRPIVASRPELLKKIKDLPFSEAEREALEKDFMLIEAALSTDCCISSMDEIVKQLLVKAASNVGELKQIIWVNPDKSPQELTDWLAEGALPSKGPTLGEGKGDVAC